MGKSATYWESFRSFFLIRWIANLVTWVLIIPVRLYQWLISPWLPRTCRYYPTCSEYAVDALRIHGPLAGFLLGARRILSCHPWGGQGHDPVPPGGTPFRELFQKRRKDE